MTLHRADPRTKVYVSGPMTGLPEYNYPAFTDACVRLRAAGYEVVSPHEVNPPDGIDHPWDWYLRRDIVALMACDTIACLSGWEQSKGAGVETYIGSALGMAVVPLAELLSVSDRADPPC